MTELDTLRLIADANVAYAEADEGPWEITHRRVSDLVAMGKLMEWQEMVRLCREARALRQAT